MLFCKYCEQCVDTLEMQVVKLLGKFIKMSLHDFRCTDDPLSRFLRPERSIFHTRYFRYQD